MAEWTTFREVAGVDIRVRGKLVEALLTDSIRAGLPSLFDASVSETRARLAVKQADWDGKRMAPEMEIRYRNRRWRIGPHEFHESAPIVFFDIIRQA